MSTIDMTQVAGLQAVNAEGQVIGTLSVDDLTELVATKIVQEAKNEAISARSESVMSEASTLSATDEYEDQLALDTNPAYVRSLDSDGNPKRTATTSLATVVGGLIGIETLQLSKLVSYSAQLGDGTYKLIDKSTTKGTFRFVYLEDRYQPFIFYISIYNPSYKSEYRVNKIVNGIASSSFKFIYDVEGNIYFQKTGGSRGSILSIQLVAGFATTTIEKVDSVDGTEITIS